MTLVYDTAGRLVPVYDTAGRLVWGGDQPAPPDPPALDTLRGVTADLWRTGRVTQNRVPNAASTYLSVHRVRAEAKDLRLTYGGQLPTGVSMSCAVAVEVAGSGSRVVARWGGAGTVTLTGGTSETTDPIDVHVYPDDVLHVYTYYGQRSDGQNHPGTPAVWASHEILPGNQVASGVARTSGSYPGEYGYWAVMPHAINGLAHVDTPSWVLLGDSITESGSPGLTPAPVGRQTQARTWAHRSLDGAFPVANTASWGSSYALGRTGIWGTIPDLSAYTHALVAWGYNDLDQAWQVPARDVAYVQRNAIAAWAWIAGEGPTVYQATVSPSTDSTDGWATVAGQTPRVSLPYRQVFNEWLRDGAPIDGAEPVAAGGAGIRAGDEGHPLAGIIDQAALVSTEPDSGIFRTDHGPLTADGGHPNDTGHSLMAGAMTALLA